MDTQAFVILIRSLAEQQVWLLPFLMLTIKTTVLLMTALILTSMLHNSSASTRHLIWFVMVFALLFFPLFLTWLPELNITIPEQWAFGLNEINSVNSISENKRLVNGSLGLLFLLYVTVGFISLLTTLLRIVRIVKISRGARVKNGSKAEKILAQFLEIEGLDMNINIRFSPEVSSPVSWGFISHFILLPETAVSWNEERLSNVIAHELSHIERFDWLSLIVGRIVLAMYWFNPFVWFALNKMNEEAELACDDAVVMDQNHVDYAQTLLTLAKDAQVVKHRPTLVKAVANSFLGKRVNAILNSNSVRVRTESLFLLRALLFGFPIVALVASINLTFAKSIHSEFSDEQNYFYVEYIKENSNALQPVEPDAEFTLPVRSVFKEIPAIPVMETVVNRNEIEKYLEAYSVNDAGNYPRISLEEFSLSMIGAERREILRHSYPVYPESAKRSGIEGFTVVEFELDAAGKVIKPRIVESNPATVFDRNSLKALESYRYTPRLKQNNSMLNATLKMRFVFQLQPEPG